MDRIKNKILGKIKKTKFMLVLPFVVWPVLFVTAMSLVFYFYYDIFYRDMEDKAINVAYETSAAFVSYLDQIDIAIMASASAIDYMIEKDVSDEEIIRYLDNESDKLGPIAMGGIRSIFGYFRGKLLDPISWNPDENYDALARPWYTCALEAGGKVVVIGPFVDARTGDEIIAVSKLLEDGKSVVTFGILVETLQAMTAKVVQTDDYHKVMLMRSDGMILAHSDEEEIGKNYATDDGIIRNAIYTESRDCDERGLFRINIDQKSFLGFRQEILLDLNVITVTDSDRDLKTLFRSILVFSVFLCLGIIIIVYLNINSYIKDAKAIKNAENIGSIANVYVTMHRMDLVNNTFEQITCKDYKVGKSISLINTNLKTLIKRVMDEVTDERSKEEVLKFVDLDTLDERMRNHDTLSIEFLNYDHLWHRGRFIVVNRDSNKNVTDVIWAVELIDEEKRARDRLQYMADTDLMTGINNRGSGEKKIREQLLMGTGGMFLLFDVDKFKYVNDNFGHDVGDKVLIGIADAMRRNFRTQDIIMRLGGDEFAVFAPNIFDEESGNLVVERLIESVENMVIPEMSGYTVHISIGAAFYLPTDTFSFDELYKRADSCTYESKKVPGSKVTYHKRRDM